MEQFQLNPEQKERLAGQVEDVAMAASDLELEAGNEGEVLRKLKGLGFKLQKLKEISDPELLKYKLVLRRELAIKLGLDYVGQFKDGLAIVQKGETMNFINENGEFLLDFECKSVREFSEDMAVVEKMDGEKIYVKKNGKSIYKDVWAHRICKEDCELKDFSKGFGRIYKKGSGYIQVLNKDGKNIIDTSHYKVRGDFSDGFICAERGADHVYLDKKGKERLGGFEQTTAFKKGFAWVKRRNSGKGWELIDKTGKSVIEDSYNEVQEFSEGVAWVKKWRDGNWFWELINRRGEILSALPGDADEPSPFKDGVSLVTIKENKHTNIPAFYYLNKKGEKLFDGKAFYQAEAFQNGFARVRDSLSRNGWFFINKQGKDICNGKRFYSISAFNEGLAIVGEYGEGYYCYFINEEGDDVFNGQRFSNLFNFVDGFAIVEKGGDTWFVNKEGKEFAKDKYFDLICEFKGGVALAYEPECGEQFYIDIYGNRIFDQDDQDK